MDEAIGAKAVSLDILGHDGDAGSNRDIKLDVRVASDLGGTAGGVMDVVLWGKWR